MKEIRNKLNSVASFNFPNYTSINSFLLIICQERIVLANAEEANCSHNHAKLSSPFSEQLLPLSFYHHAHKLVLFSLASDVKTLTGHLFNALTAKKILTYIDYRLERGAVISLLKAIEGSKMAIVIFSEHYADSKWCFEELLMIADYMKKVRW